MIVSPDVLRKELLSLIAQIDEQIVEVKNEAARRGIPSERFRDNDGGWIMAPLLSAKVTALSALVQLNKKER